MTRTAVVAGVGPGLGSAVAERFAAEGCEVALLARSEDYLTSVADRLRSETPGDALALPTDLADPMTIEHSFDRVHEAFGSIDVLVNHASSASWAGLLDHDPDAFRRALAVGPEAALHCSQAAVPDMVEGDGGTVIFTGATTSVRGREGAVGDGATRPPDADPDAPGEASLDPDAIADSYWTLVRQDRSAWTLELDLRPHVEDF
ncbi:short-chain dehydrogenase [Halobacteriales archaeon SW_12_69_24]|nr:MAG: short-chain dehydrogenase [Halobacteriales archaeon SW_12_69_24]